MEKDEEVKKNLEKVKDLPVLDRMAKSFMKVHAEREMLAGYVQDFEKQHNELYLFMVAMMRKFGSPLLIEREHYPVLDFREYILEWEDCPELGGVRATLRHFSEGDDEQRDK